MDNFPNNGILSSADVQDALQAYVDVLTAQADNSVTIAVIGYPMNIRDVLKNYPDLFESKVKEVFFMNGFYNFGCAEGHWLGPVGDCADAAAEMEEMWPHSVKQYF